MFDAGVRGLAPAAVDSAERAPSLYKAAPASAAATDSNDRSGCRHKGQIWWEEAGYSHERGVGQ